MRPISIIAAAEFGAVRVHDPQQLLKAFDRVSQQTSCEVLFVVAGMGPHLTDHFKKHGLRDFRTFKPGFFTSHGIAGVWVDTDQDQGAYVRCDCYKAGDAFAKNLYETVQKMGHSVP